MSHFYTVVLVPKPSALNGSNLQDPATWTTPLQTQVHGLVEALMAPYDENMKVEEHQTECHCVGWAAKMAAREAGNKTFGDYNDLRAKFREQYAEQIKDLDPFGEEQKKLWQEFTRMTERREFEDTFEKNHVLHGKPDPSCDSCNGTGEYPTTSNSNAHWDWWRVGGRWCGAIQNREPPDDKEGGFNFGDRYEALDYNTRSVADMLDNWTVKDTPFALVLPDGSWHERGEMGWWGVVSDEKDRDKWSEQAKVLLEKHRDCIAIGCDCHI